jgi:hypothetical protein
MTVCPGSGMRTYFTKKNDHDYMAQGRIECPKCRKMLTPVRGLRIRRHQVPTKSYRWPDYSYGPYPKKRSR